MSRIESDAGTVTVSAVRIEGRPKPVSLDTGSPRISWQLEGAEAGWLQEKAEITFVGRRGTLQAVVDTASTQNLSWPFAPLDSGDRGTVRVRSFGSDGRWTAESEAAPFSVGLLHASDWQARMVGPISGSRVDPAPEVFTRFEARPGLVKATLYASALGLYDLRIDAERVSANLFEPGWTSYRHRLRYAEFDVTEHVAPGSHELSFALGNGWYRGRLGFRGNASFYGDRLGVIAMLKLSYEDGSEDLVATDESWSARTTAILSNDLYDGQTTDLRDFAAQPLPIEVFPFDPARLVAPESEPVTVLQTVEPVEITRTDRGTRLIDLGQNIVGWVRFTVRTGQTESVVTVRHAEVLEDGELSLRPLRSAEATDRYLVGADQQSVCEPLFTFHGFRFVEIEVDAEAEISSIEGVVIGTALTRTGWFSCSNPLLDRFHENVVWSAKGNFFSIPIDCPQRDERLGWTADIQVFTPAASFLFDVSSFLSSWLRDLAVEQYPDGGVPAVVPDILHDVLPAGSEAIAAWGDAACIVPLALYNRYGDATVLARQFESMSNWTQKILSLAGDDLIWRGGFQFGDWLDPDAPPDDPFRAKADTAVVATAHLIRSLDSCATAADVLGLDSEATELRELAARARGRFQAEFVADGRVTSDCQTVYALAICWNLLATSDDVERAGERLAELVVEADYRVSTGFVGTPLILDALDLTGRADLAVRMLTEEDCPSWLYPVTMGATTTWERWDSLLPDGRVNPGQMTSFNHYALGATAEWIHRRIGGIETTSPGSDTVRVAPITSTAITSAQSTLDTRHGRVSVEWSTIDDAASLAVTVPYGTSAEVHFGGKVVVVGHGNHHFINESD